MSDGSLSSREISPRPFQARSPGSDAGSVAPSPWHSSSNTLHPSSFQSPASSPAPLLRQPVGFGATANASSYHPSHSSPSPHYYHPSRAIEELAYGQKSTSLKGKERERLPDKAKDTSRSRKGKERDKGVSVRTGAHVPDTHPQPPLAHFTPDAHKKKAFRVRAYANDTGAGGTPYNDDHGPYGASYRADVGPPPSSDNHPQSTPSQSNHTRAPPHNPPEPSSQPKPSHYRYDYDKIRESAPANRTKQAAGASTNAIPPSHLSRDPTRTHNPDDHNRRAHSSRSKDTHMYPTDYFYTAPEAPYDDTYDSFQSNAFDARPFQPHYADTGYQPVNTPDIHVPSHATPREKRHKSRSHRHHHSSTPTQAFQPQPPPQADAAQSAVRVCRVLTLLIEDKRGRDGENMLTEVRVPLKEGGGDVAYWADAQDVTDELQRGPSRIDGSAKVYTLRGKYKQYFLRIAADGEQVCQSANLKVGPERTLEIFIEDNPPPTSMPIAPPSPPPHFERGLLTPITDSMTTPSPAPAPVSLPGHNRASHSSLFSSEDYPSPAADEQKFDLNAIATNKKRPRSSSIQSIQSTRSYVAEDYSQAQPHDAFTPPFSSRHTSVRSSTAQSRTPSQSSPGPHPRLSEPPQMSPVLAPTPQPTRIPSQPPPQLELQIPRPPSPRRVLSSSSSGPSPPKKTKLIAPQIRSHTEHSGSPGPGQLGSYTLSHSRTASMSNEYSVAGNSSGITPSTTVAGFASSSGFGTSTAGFSSSTGFNYSPTGFAAYANLDTKKPSTSRSTSSSNPFSRYDPGPFSLTTSHTQEASGSTISQANLALPSASTQINLPTIPSLSSVSNESSLPTTVPPSAMTVTPTLSGQVSSDLDNIVGRYIRSIIDKEPDWAAFVEYRKKMLTMREQLPHYEYVQQTFDRFIGKTTPPDLEGAGGVTMTKAQVMRAFNLPLAWGESCTETLVLTLLYGPHGTRGEDPRVTQMLDEKPAITPKMTATKYLTLLREVHGQWTINNPG